MRRMISLAALVLLGGALLVQIGCSKKDDNPTTPPPPCSINILSPAAGSSFLSGTDQTTIRWEKAGASKTVRIDLLKGAGFDSTIVAAWTSITTPASYSWNVSSMGQGSGDDYALRITAAEDTACNATVGPLTILQVNNCSVTFPYTVKDSIPEQTAGDVFDIEWTAVETTGKVTLELYDSGPGGNPGNRVGLIAADVDAAAGTYAWTVDSFNRGTYDFFRLRIYDSQLTGCTQWSIPFRIVDDVICTIDVLGISQDTVFNPGQTATLTFNGSNNSGLVNLRLIAGALDVPGGNIVTGYDLSQGAFTWTVTDFGWNDDNSRYKIQATDSSDEYCIGESERFTITR